jgi:mycoredoxin
MEGIVGPPGSGPVPTAESHAIDPEIVVYWRPGCGWCSALRRQLARAGVAHRLVNIWEDADAAARVRAVARGHETVPTVMIGTVALVNPGIREVLAAADVHAPSAVERTTPGSRGGLGGFVARVFDR